MKLFVSFLFVAAVALLYPCHSLAQSPSGDNTVSVAELAMPRKAVQAFEKGTALLIKGEPQASVPYFQKVIALAPNASYRTYHNLALAYYRLAQFDASAENFQKAIDISKGNFAPSMFGLAMILYRREDFQHAEAIVQRGLFLTPGSSLGKYCYGLIQYSLGKFADAERDALAALQFDPGQVDAYLLLAHVHERQHNPNAVIADVQSYLKLTPNRQLESDANALLDRAQHNLARLALALNKQPESTLQPIPASASTR